MKPGRIHCLVPFCRITAAEEKFPNCTEIICRKHWMLVPQRQRRFLQAVERRLRRTMDPQRRLRLRWMQHWAWQRIRRMAIERAAGL